MIDFEGLRLQRSECALALTRIDWTRHPLGPVGEWPTALRAAVQLCLNSRFPMTLAWGAELAILYNDGYLPILGSKHPGSFGRPAFEVYDEIADFLRPRLQNVLDGGESVWEINQLLPMVRNELAEEGYYTFCYSAVPDHEGRIGGVLAVATETTAHVVQARRSALTLSSPMR